MTRRSLKTDVWDELFKRTLFTSIDKICQEIVEDAKVELEKRVRDKIAGLSIEWSKDAELPDHVEIRIVAKNFDCGGEQ